MTPAVIELRDTDGTLRRFDAAKGEIALVVIDVQREFCDPNGWARRGNQTTEDVAGAIAAAIPQFEEAGVPARIVYSARQPLPAAQVDLYKLRPSNPDDLTCKFNNSAFAGTQLSAKLEHQGARLLLFVGFNTSACIMDTIRSMPGQFTPCVLEDLTGNDEDASRFGRSLPALQQMHAEGIHLAKSADLLPALAGGAAAQVAAAMPPLSEHHHRDATRPLRPRDPAVWLGR